MRRKLFWIAASCILALVGLLPVFSSGTSPAVKEKVIYSFTGAPDGRGPSSDLTFDKAGNLYGTTQYGGTGSACSLGCGTVFELKRSESGWTEQVLYSFTGGNDGGIPQAGVIFDNDGKLYGMAGNVFKLSPNSHGGWTETTIYTLGCSKSAGCSPAGDLAIDTKGNLYGATSSGSSGSCYYRGSSGCGAVFELTPQSGGTWTENTLHQFAGADGQSPAAGLILDAAGNLYGTTSYGGSGSCIIGEDILGYANGCGTVYELTSSGGTWMETVLYNFVRGGGLGVYPSGELLFVNPNHLVGVTQAGGDNLGTFFEIQNTKSGWKRDQAHIFFGPPGDGWAPIGRLVENSNRNVLGVTTKGGANKTGVVFELEPLENGSNEKILYNFGGNGSSDGQSPGAGLVIDSQRHLYGTTQGGGTGCTQGGCGTVYELTP